MRSQLLIIAKYRIIPKEDYAILSSLVHHQAVNSNTDINEGTKVQNPRRLCHVPCI